MSIITINREFGSGGRELGALLARRLKFDYFDGKILSAIAKNRGMDRDFVSHFYDQPNHDAIPLTRFNTFAGISLFNQHTELLLEQKHVIEEIPRHSKNCVIVGRNADVLLSSYRPFTVFVCADLETKLRRCRERQQPDSHLPDRELEHKIHEVDKARRQTNEVISGLTWGDSHNYQLVINTSGWKLPDLVEPLASFARAWFAKIP